MHPLVRVVGLRHPAGPGRQRIRMPAIIHVETGGDDAHDGSAHA